MISIIAVPAAHQPVDLRERMVGVRNVACGMRAMSASLRAVREFLREIPPSMFGGFIVFYSELDVAHRVAAS